MVIVEGGYLMIILDVIVRWYAPSRTKTGLVRRLYTHVGLVTRCIHARAQIGACTCTYWGLFLRQKLASRVQSKESARSDVILKMPYCHKIL